MRVGLRSSSDFSAEKNSSRMLGLLFLHARASAFNLVTARARGHASSGGVTRRHKHYGCTSLLPLPGGFVFGDNNCSAVSSSSTGPRTTVLVGQRYRCSPQSTIPSFVSIAEKRRSMRSCASEATNGHRVLASHFHLVRNVRGAFTHTCICVRKIAHTCTCTRQCGCGGGRGAPRG